MPVRRFAVTAKTRTKLPRVFTHTVAFNALSSTAIKTFLYLVARRQAEPRLSKEVRFTWRDLYVYLSEDDQREIEGNDYRSFSNALRLLYTIYVEHVKPPTKGHRWGTRESYTLVTGWEHDEYTGHVVVKLNADFDYALSLMGADHFTLVTLQQAARLTDPRALRMLLWCYEFEHLYDPAQRTLDLAALRKRLGLLGESYDSWRQLQMKLSQYQHEINTRTEMRLLLRPIKRLGKVVAVEFDVRKEVAAKRLKLKTRAKTDTQPRG